MGERGGGLRGCERYRGSSRSKDALGMTAGTGNGEEQEQTTAKCGGPSTAAAKYAASGRDDGSLVVGRDDGIEMCAATACTLTSGG